MTEKIKFSVVIPLYNKENLVNRAINSVLSQTYDEYEIIVVNDGSTDNSVKSIEPFIMSGKVRLINKDNGGVSSARNVGILKSNNKYVAFLDADDTWDINFLEVISSLICKTKNAALWGGRQRLIKPDGGVIYSGVSYLDDNYKNYVYDKGEHSKKHINDEHYQMPELTEEIVYALRCSIVHSGDPNLNKKDTPVDKFNLTLNKDKTNSTIAKSTLRMAFPAQDKPFTERGIKVDIYNLCNLLCKAAISYYNSNKNKFTFINYTIEEL